MTKEAAIKELAELEPREAEAWTNHRMEIEGWQRRIDAEYQKISRMNADKERATASTHARWFPLHARKSQLKAFIELSV